MCTLGCKGCNKNNIYLGTSVQNFENLSDFGDFDGVVFTDCLMKAREDAYQRQLQGKESIVVAHPKGKISFGALDEISDADYGYNVFTANHRAVLNNFISV